MCSLALLTVAFLGLAVEPARSLDASGFAGVWLRDEEASDDVLAVVEETLGAGSTPRGPATRGPGGGAAGSAYPSPPGVSFPGFGRGRRGRRTAPGSTSPDRPDPAVWEHLAKGLRVLKIETAGEQLTIRNANRETRVLWADGRPFGDGLVSHGRAGFEGDALVVVTEGGGRRARETYELSTRGDRLRLTLETEVDGTSVRLATVYDLVERPAAAAPAPSAPVAVAEESAGTPRSTTRSDDARVGAAAAAVAKGTPVGTAAPASSGEWGRSEAAFRPAVLRILPPRTGGGLLSGKALFETLTMDPAVATVEFFLDGERFERRVLPPFEAKASLADPPREQVVRAVALDRQGGELGSDELVVNRVDPPFRVRIAAIDRVGGSLRVRAEVSVPRKAELERVVFDKGEERLASLAGPPFEVEIPGADVGPQDYVRAAATLRDGRQLEDVSLLTEGVFSAELDVHLVQLQVLVTDRFGAPVTGLEAGDFDVTDGGRQREIERLYPSTDVALVLGLAIDSSGSMQPLWQQTRYASTQFLETTLGARDRAFIVDFDSRLRLLQPLTSDKAALYSAMSRPQPEGGTALYDSILFSLLQFEDEPGRRALVVLSDGVDSESRADPRRAIDFGERLGVPVYVLGLSGARGPGWTGPADAAALDRSRLMLITRPTGGRFFHVGSSDQVARAYAQIRDELRHQYILTYYTDRPPARAERPRVEVLRKGLEVRTALPLDLAD